MQLDALAHVGNESRVGPVPVSDLCKRVRFRQSECRVCADICPTNAISLPFGPEFSEDCINCGLCQIVCPMEAIEGLHNTDQMLLELLRDQVDTIVNNNKLSVHCHQAEAKDAGSVAVNCLGNLTENALTAMAGAYVKTLAATTGECSSCKMCQGREVFMQAATTYTQLYDMLSLTPVTITIIATTKTRESDKSESSQPSSATSRREFFRSLGNGVAKQAAKVVVDKEQQIRALLQTEDATAQKRPSHRKQMLRELLVEQLPNARFQDEDRIDSVDQTAEASFPWKKMHVDVAYCVGCGVCVNVCPTGALTKEIDDLELTRTINYGLCTNCGVCAEACPQDVISFIKSCNVGDIVRDTEEVVAKVPLNACFICGEIIPVSEGEVCTTCQKRQVVPMFM